MTPLDAFERWQEWQRAVLMVALVVTGMSDHAGPAAPATRPAAASRRAQPADVAPGRRHVRPPRSC